MDLSKKDRILVVEDEDEVRQVIIETLLDSGLEVIGASNGQQALSHLEATSFGAMVSDIQMPGMTGIELLAEVRNRKMDLPVILLTAHADRERLSLATKLGAFDFLEKPFSLSLLSDAILRAIKKQA
jgi:DNA-binding NtrC family response regulator